MDCSVRRLMGSSVAVDDAVRAPLLNIFLAVEADALMEAEVSSVTRNILLKFIVSSKKETRCLLCYYTNV